MEKADRVSIACCSGLAGLCSPRSTCFGTTVGTCAVQLVQRKRQLAELTAQYEPIRDDDRLTPTWKLLSGIAAESVSQFSAS